VLIKIFCHLALCPYADFSNLHRYFLLVSRLRFHLHCFDVSVLLASSAASLINWCSRGFEATCDPGRSFSNKKVAWSQIPDKRKPHTVVET